MPMSVLLLVLQQIASDRREGFTSPALTLSEILILCFLAP